MRIATLQFTPKLGDVEASIVLAESLLYKDESRLHNLDLLVLPELAFSGYNFPSLTAITPHLEPTAAGTSTKWAIKTAERLRCTVAVGYPERCTSVTTLSGPIGIYNALVFVSAAGNIVAHYRKTFLYYSDEIWASEGQGFFADEISLGTSAVTSQSGTTNGVSIGIIGEDSRERRVKIAAGICMDINPYRFTSPWTAYEFANHALSSQAKLIVLSCAWLTHLSSGDLRSEPNTPDLNTFGYWIERLQPLIGANGPVDEVIVVFANRTGEEGTAVRIGDVKYAGSSCVMGMRKGDGVERGRVRIWDILGRAEEGLLVVDTEDEPKFGLGRRKEEARNVDGDASDGGGDEDDGEEASEDCNDNENSDS